MGQPPDHDHHGDSRNVRVTAEALADAVDDPVLTALLEDRPIVALILRAHPYDHVTVYDRCVAVAFGQQGEAGTLTIDPGLAARLCQGT